MRQHPHGTTTAGGGGDSIVIALSTDKVSVKRFFHDSPPARSILIPIETRSDRAVPTRDRFSTLPVDMKLKILELIPFEEAARTRILSSTSNWSEHSQVILDKLLFEERGRWISRHPTAWVTKVAEILNNHRKGPIPIRKFIIHIPDMALCRDKVLVKRFFHHSPPARSILIPIETRSDRAVHTGDRFSTLPVAIKLYSLEHIPFEEAARTSFSSSTTFGSKIVGAVTISAPSLVRSELVDCAGFQHLNIHAPKLENFVVASCDGMSRDDANQMRLKLGGTTIDKEGDPNCSSCGGCRCIWREPGYRVKYVFYPGNGRKQFAFCPEVKRARR
ncbi:hypothetical protein LOK49_LG10G00541 [Camellia lanceoleosa]|uniref:Uncharacterized protein n=1 Tax=Camellia lanceoleosa TaxID=1840588 RepID=A0ACC0GD66_9ERIC|nr:hypothetical protein LOK49_LG10G00541 [Camellia lanceoleosa]